MQPQACPILPPALMPMPPSPSRRRANRALSPACRALALALGLAGPAAAQSPPPPAATATSPGADARLAATNLRDFDFLTDTLRRNYSGWDTKVTDANRAQLDALTQRLRAAAATATPPQLFALFGEWFAFFGDGHIGCKPLVELEPPAADLPTAGAAGTPTYDWTEASVRAQLDQLGSRRDPLEGIWRLASDRYRVGVLRVGASADAGEFAAVVLATTAANWRPGQEKARLTRAADGALRVQYRKADHSEVREVGQVVGDGVALRLGRWGTWTRAHPDPAPAVEADRLDASDQLFLRRLSPSTLWLRLPDFHDARAEPLQQLLAAHADAVASCPNLVIDLRENGGGSDYVYAPLLDLLYTRPIYRIHAELRATADNVALRRDLADRLRTERPDIAGKLDALNERMAANLGSFVTNSDKPFDVLRCAKVLPFPKRIAILIDDAGSSGEQFLLDARQSRKVTLFGYRNSAGVLDFANVVEKATPSGRWAMYWATSRSLRLPDDPVDPDGIAPDIRIPNDVLDPIGFAQAWLERQVD